MLFQSTHLLRGATVDEHSFGGRKGISIHAPLTRCDKSNKRVYDYALISIHAPLTRCDTNQVGAVKYDRISIHAPLTRCDSCNYLKLQWIFPFQSTHLLRGATIAAVPLSPGSFSFQSTHLLRGATAGQMFAITDFLFQSTHLLRGATTLSSITGSAFSDFNPRTSYEVRRRSMQRRALH